MGEYREYHCTKCSWKKTIKLGTGMLQFYEAKQREVPSAEEKASEGKYGLPLKSFLEAKTSKPIDCWENDAVFYCPDCHDYKKSSILYLQYDYNGSFVKVSVFPYCKTCSMEMIRIDEPSGENWLDLQCPECGGPVEEGPMILFD